MRSRGMLAALGLGLLLALAATSSSSAQAFFFHVRVDGSDELGDGSSERPWASIEHAMEQVPDATDVVVFVGPGRHAVPETLSKTTSGRLTFRALPAYAASLALENSPTLTISGARLSFMGFLFERVSEDLRAGESMLQIVGSEIRIADCIFKDEPRLMAVSSLVRDVLVEGNWFAPAGGAVGEGGALTVNAHGQVRVIGNIIATGEGEGLGPAAPLVSFIGAPGGSTLERNILIGGSGRDDRAMVEVDGLGLGAVSIGIESNLILGLAHIPSSAGISIGDTSNLRLRANTLVAGSWSQSMLNFGSRARGGQSVMDTWIENNIVSDPTGVVPRWSMVLDEESVETTVAHNNLYASSTAKPTGDPLGPEQDPAAVLGNPFLPDASDLEVPTWDPATGRFTDGSATISEVFQRLARYANPAPGSPAIDRADGSRMPIFDLLGKPRGVPDIGAVEHGVWTPIPTRPPNTPTPSPPPPDPDAEPVYLPKLDRGDGAR